MERGADGGERRDGVALVTGATSGVGRATARRLAAAGLTVVVTGRDRERGAAAAAECEAAGGAADFRRVDLAELDAVRALAATVREEHGRLDVLVNNAACSRSDRVLVGGVEETFLVNHLAPFLLTYDLAGLLVGRAPARVVTVASRVHRRGDLDLGDLNYERRSYDALEAYATSKLANVLFTYELAARLDGTGVTANAVHPGFVPGSRLYRDASLPVRIATRLATLVPGVGSTVDDGAERVAALALSPDVATATGTYFEGCEPTESAPATYDETLRRRLWERSAELVGVESELPVGR